MFVPPVIPTIHPAYVSDAPMLRWAAMGLAALAFAFAPALVVALIAGLSRHGYL